VWRGTALLVVGRLWSSACTLLTLVLLARRLDSEGFGRLTFYLAVFLLLDSLADLGTGQVAVQRTAAEPELVPGVLRATRRIRLVTSSAGVLLVALSVTLMREPGAGWILLASLYPVTHVLELSTLVFKNRIAWSKPVMVRIAASSASLIFVLLGLLAGLREPALFLLAIALGSTLGNLGLFLVARPLLPRAPGPPVALTPILRSALPIGIAGLCQQTYFYVDNLFIRALVEDAPLRQLGHYNIAVRVMSYGIMVAVYSAMAALPWLARERAAGRLPEAAARLAQPMLVLGGVGTGLLWPWCSPLLALFGPGFEDAAPSLRWLLLATFTVYAGATMMTAVVASGRSRAVLAIAVLGLTVNLVGNSWLVPLRGIEGAAIATLATELVVAIAASAVVFRSGGSSGRLHRHAWWLLGPAAFLAAATLSSLLPFP
jgi:O-antigen/teichoic acid export membrane protein